jgi:hypothetical protein
MIYPNITSPKELIYNRVSILNKISSLYQMNVIKTTNENVRNHLKTIFTVCFQGAPPKMYLLNNQVNI